MGSVRALSTGGNIKLFHLFVRHLLSIFCGRNQGCTVNGQPLNAKREWALVMGSLEMDRRLGTGCLIGINPCERRGRGRSDHRDKKRAGIGSSKPRPAQQGSQGEYCPIELVPLGQKGLVLYPPTSRDAEGPRKGVILGEAAPCS